MPKIRRNIESQSPYIMSHSKNIRKWLVGFVQKLANENSTPHSIAMGFTLGTFIAILPTPGFGAFLALSLTLVFKVFNRLAVIVSITIWNPLLLFPLYYLCYLLGSVLLARPIDPQEVISLYEMLSEYTYAFLLGNIILAVLISAISYIGIYQLMTVYVRHQRLRKLMQLYKLRSPKTV